MWENSGIGGIGGRCSGVLWAGAGQVRQEGDSDDTVPAWRAGLAGRRGGLGILGGILLVTAYLFTKGPEARYAKLCVRSKQMEKDFFNDPKKAEWARSKGYKGLQDPDCKEWPEFWEAVKPF
ncbi:unnamed protein product [Cladocopium goreaui]|uniref:Sulfate adenylyltransferase n=1 Tax=Cladocopium goreaui TaxID=2562237 RepID=A0A9P1BPD1_9DINO|nr:unnamed protein product [Cladocopium goreaui]